MSMREAMPAEIAKQNDFIHEVTVHSETVVPRKVQPHRPDSLSGQVLAAAGW